MNKRQRKKDAKQRAARQTRAQFWLDEVLKPLFPWQRRIWDLIQGLKPTDRLTVYPRPLGSPRRVPGPVVWDSYCQYKEALLMVRQAEAEGRVLSMWDARERLRKRDSVVMVPAKYGMTQTVPRPWKTGTMNEVMRAEAGRAVMGWGQRVKDSAHVEPGFRFPDHPVIPRKPAVFD